MRAMVIGLWVMMTKRVSVLAAISSIRLQKRSTLCIVERRVDLVEHADRRGVGQEHREDQRHGGERLLAARQERHGLRFLARRAGHDFKPGIQRVVGFDQLQFRRAAAKQMGEQPLELAVDLLKGDQQALAAFPVEALDSGAQFLDRVDDVLALGDDGFEPFRRVRPALPRRAD
jgi:hypothetical protein